MALTESLHIAPLGNTPNEWASTLSDLAEALLLRYMNKGPIPERTSFRIVEKISPKDIQAIINLPFETSLVREIDEPRGLIFTTGTKHKTSFAQSDGSFNLHTHPGDAPDASRVDIHNDHLRPKQTISLIASRYGITIQKHPDVSIITNAPQPSGTRRARRRDFVSVSRGKRGEIVDRQINAGLVHDFVRYTEEDRLASLLAIINGESTWQESKASILK